VSGVRRTALITGSGKNIGRAVALALANDGFNVAVNGSQDRDSCESVAEEARGLGVDAVVAMGDIGSPEGAASVAKAAIDAFGAVDVLINNAAIRPKSPFLEMDEAEWHRVLNVDLNAAFWLSRACLPAMIERGWGRIVNFAGMNALKGYASRPHVSVAKHGAWGLTKSLAMEFGPKGITVNIISPGPIGTEHDDNPEMAAHIQSQVGLIPVGRLGHPDEVAAATAMLVSDGGAFINGQLIQVNGGAQT